MNQPISTLQASAATQSSFANTAQQTLTPLLGWPTGLDIGDYTGFDAWTKEEWAWQFLRRNEAFQERCDRIRGWPDGRMKRHWQRNTAHTFGLKKFKDYIEDFASGDNPNPKFSSASISIWSRVDEKTYENQILPTSLRPAQALIRFDIEAMRKSKKSLNAQLKDAKRRLEMALKVHLKKTNSAARGTKLKAPLIEMLRAYDAEKFKRSAGDGKSLTYPVMAAKILPQEPLPLNPVEEIESRIVRGKEHVESLYLDLVAAS